MGCHWVHGRLGTTLKLHGGVYYHPSCSIMANLAQSAFSLIPAIGWCQKSPWTSTRSRICRSLGMSSEPTMTRTAYLGCILYLIYEVHRLHTCIEEGLCSAFLLLLGTQVPRQVQLHTITSRSPNPFSQPAVSIATSIFKVLHRNGLLPSQFLKHRSNITGGCSFLYPRILLKILPDILLGQRVSCFMSVVISILLGISISKQFNYTYNIQYVTYVTYVACQSPNIFVLRNIA